MSVNCPRSSSLLSGFTPLRIRRHIVPAVFAIYEPEYCGYNISDYLARLPSDVAVIFRGYHIHARTRRIIEAAELCASRHIPFFPAVAHTHQQSISFIRDMTNMSIPYDGIHLSSHVTISDALLLRDMIQGRIITRAAHNVLELKGAFLSDADLCFISPVFPTSSHPGAPALYISGFYDLARATPLYTLALGGIVTPKHVQLILQDGIRGFASIGYFHQPET